MKIIFLLLNNNNILIIYCDNIYKLHLLYNNKY